MSVNKRKIIDLTNDDDERAVTSSVHECAFCGETTDTKNLTPTQIRNEYVCKECVEALKYTFHFCEGCNSYLCVEEVCEICTICEHCEKLTKEAQEIDNMNLCKGCHYEEQFICRDCHVKYDDLNILHDRVCASCIKRNNEDEDEDVVS